METIELKFTNNELKVLLSALSCYKKYLQLQCVSTRQLHDIQCFYDKLKDKLENQNLVQKQKLEYEIKALTEKLQTL